MTAPRRLPHRPPRPIRTRMHRARDGCRSVTRSRDRRYRASFPGHDRSYNPHRAGRDRSGLRHWRRCCRACGSRRSYRHRVSQLQQRVRQPRHARPTRTDHNRKRSSSGAAGPSPRRQRSQPLRRCRPADGGVPDSGSRRSESGTKRGRGCRWPAAVGLDHGLATRSGPCEVIPSFHRAVCSRSSRLARRSSVSRAACRRGQGPVLVQSRRRRLPSLRSSRPFRPGHHARRCQSAARPSRNVLYVSLRTWRSHCCCVASACRSAWYRAARKAMSAAPHAPAAPSAAPTSSATVASTQRTIGPSYATARNSGPVRGGCGGRGRLRGSGAGGGPATERPPRATSPAAAVAHAHDTSTPWGRPRSTPAGW